MAYSDKILVTALGHVIAIVVSPDGLLTGVFCLNRKGEWRSGSWYTSELDARERRSELFKLHRKLAKERAAITKAKGA